MSLFNRNTPFVKKKTTFQNLNPKGQCCNDDADDGLHVTSVAFLPDTPSPGDYTLELTLNDGSTVQTQVPAAAFTDVTVASFARHPDALTDPTLFHTIRITLTDGSTFDLNLLPILSQNINVLYVNKGGDDAIAAAAGNYNEHAPWANPTRAMAAASPGDVVVVEAGLYTIGTGGDIPDNGSEYLVRDGVTLYCLPGATIRYTTTTGFLDTDISRPFDDGGNPATFIIRGSGVFEFNSTINTGGAPLFESAYVGVVNENTVVDWEFDEISTARGFGGSVFNCALWRMVGRRIESREAQLFVFRYTGVVTDRRMEIKVEHSEFRADNPSNTTWTRMELRSFGDGSVADIDMGNSTWPFGFPNGGWFQVSSAQDNAIINFKANSVVKNGTAGFNDWVYLSLLDRSNGTIDIKGIETQESVVRLQPSGLGTTLSKRIINLQGRVLPGSLVGFTRLGILENIGYVCQVHLDIEDLEDSAAHRGLAIQLSLHTSVSGLLVWSGNTHNAIFSNSVTGVAARLENLIVRDRGGLDSIYNANATTLNLRVIDVKTTNPVSPANGGINQLIETVTVDANI